MCVVRQGVTRRKERLLALRALRAPTPVLGRGLAQIAQSANTVLRTDRQVVLAVLLEPVRILQRWCAVRQATTHLTAAAVALLVPPDFTPTQGIPNAQYVLLGSTPFLHRPSARRVRLEPLLIPARRRAVLLGRIFRSEVSSVSCVQ